MTVKLAQKRVAKGRVSDVGWTSDRLQTDVTWWRRTDGSITECQNPKKLKNCSFGNPMDKLTVFWFDGLHPPALSINEWATRDRWQCSTSSLSSCVNAGGTLVCQSHDSRLVTHMCVIPSPSSLRLATTAVYEASNPNRWTVSQLTTS